MCQKTIDTSSLFYMWEFLEAIFTIYTKGGPHQKVRQVINQYLWFYLRLPI